MGYFVIENFKLGLDSRNFALTAPVGALVRAENCHVTPAGEIEKRKSFTLFATLPTGCFGLEVTNSGLVTFGSGSAPAMPSGVAYVQCLHPGEAAGGTASAMTGVTCSGTYAGLPWCSARFADGRVFGFYNGALVPGFSSGIVFDGLTATTAIAQNIQDALNRELADPATGVIDYSIEHSGSLNDIKAAVGGTFNLILGTNLTVGSTGSLGQTLMSTGGAGTAGVGASCIINFTTMGTGFSCTSITAPNGSGGTCEILGSAVAYSSSMANTIALIRNQINNYNSSPRYSAAVSGSALTISAPATLGDSVNYSTIATFVVLTYTEVGGTGSTTGNNTGVIALTAVASPSSVSKSRGPTTGTVILASPTVACAPAGGTAPYAYAWTCPGFTVNSPTAAASSFTASVPIDDSVWGTAYCTVTDSGSPVQTSTTNGVGITLTNAGSYN